MLFIGIDLAWGDRKPDGVCVIEATSRKARVLGYHYPMGDAELLSAIRQIIGPKGGAIAFAAIDAPIVCPNRTGTRPVDRLTHRLFHRQHAACHPANSTKCPRPSRILAKLKKNGFRAGWEVFPNPKRHTACEVYPHPAMVRLFELPRIIKYKKGTIENRRSEFRRLQRHLRACLKRHFPYLELNPTTHRLLRSPWDKATEDRLDALFCALIGLWHWKHQGRKSQIIGDIKTGFILLPRV